MKRFFEKIKSKLKKKKQPYRNITECHMCGSGNIEQLGGDKYCKDCGTIL